LLAAVAVSVTCVFCAKLALHVEGQLIPAGLLVTVPAPTAGAVTVN
jgi:phage tail protein X